MAAHLGIVDERQFDEMSYIFFEDVLEQLGHKLTYDAISNYAGNSFCEKSWEMIMENNPFTVAEKNQTHTDASMKLFEGLKLSDIKVIKKEKE